VSTTSEQLFREADLYITADEWAQDLIGGAKPAPPAPQRDTNQQPDSWEKRPREEVHAARPPIGRTRGAPYGGERTLNDILDAQCPYHKDMCHTLQNCRDFKHSVRNGRPFLLYHLPHHEEGLVSPDSPSNWKGEGVGHSHRLMGRSTSSSGDTGRRRIEGSKSSITGKSWWQPPVLQLHIGEQSTQSPSVERVNGLTLTILASTHSSSIW
jgi:hypothetical protein